MLLISKNILVEILSKTKKESETNKYGIQKSVGMKKNLILTVLVVKFVHIEVFRK